MVSTKCHLRPLRRCPSLFLSSPQRIMFEHELCHLVPTLPLKSWRSGASQRFGNVGAYPISDLVRRTRHLHYLYHGVHSHALLRDGISPESAPSYTYIGSTRMSTESSYNGHFRSRSPVCSNLATNLDKSIFRQPTASVLGPSLYRS